MYTGNNLDNDIDAAGWATKLSNLTSLPSFLQAYHPYIALQKIFLRNISAKNVLLIKLYPYNYLSRECGLYKASDMPLGDCVCEKSDADNWIDCP